MALLLFGCDRTGDARQESPVGPTQPSPTPEATPSAQSPTPTASEDAPAQPSTGEPAAPIDYPLYMPLPYYFAFYGEVPIADNTDAFLHNTAVNYYATRYNSISPHLYIPSLRLLDEWDAGDGATYYLFHAVVYHYYDMAQRLRDGNTNPGATSSPGGLMRIKLTPKSSNGSVENYWGFEAVEILESPPWGTGGADIQTLCGTRPIADFLLEAYFKNNSNVETFPHIRDILPSEYAFDHAELLAAYLKFFFPDLAE